MLFQKVEEFALQKDLITMRRGLRQQKIRFNYNKQFDESSERKNIDTVGIKLKKIFFETSIKMTIK